jgi:hypothetical protein
MKLTLKERHAKHLKQTSRIRGVDQDTQTLNFPSLYNSRGNNDEGRIYAPVLGASTYPFLGGA